MTVADWTILESTALWECHLFWSDSQSSLHQGGGGGREGSLFSVTSIAHWRVDYTLICSLCFREAVCLRQHIWGHHAFTGSVQPWQVKLRRILEYAAPPPTNHSLLGSHPSAAEAVKNKLNHIFLNNGLLRLCLVLPYPAKLSPVQSELKMSEVCESGGQMSEKQLSLYVSLEINMLMTERNAAWFTASGLAYRGVCLAASNHAWLQRWIRQVGVLRGCRSHIHVITQRMLNFLDRRGSHTVKIKTM